MSYIFKQNSKKADHKKKRDIYTKSIALLKFNKELIQTKTY